MLHSRLWEGTLRDETKNGCVADYHGTGLKKKPVQSLGFWISRRGFRIPATKFQMFCARNLDSGLQPLAGFRFAWVEYGIPKLRVLDSKSKNFPDSGFHKKKFPGPRWNPDKLTWVIWWANDPFWSKDHVLAVSVLPVGRNYDLYVFSLGKVCLFMLFYRLLCFNNFNQTMSHVPFLKTY